MVVQYFFSPCADFVFDISLAIGSGLLCSAVVSWLVEDSHNRMLRKERAMQVEFIFYELNIVLHALLFDEIQNISKAVTLMSKEKCKQVLKHAKTRDVVKQLYDMCNCAKTKLSNVDVNNPLPEQEKLVASLNKYICNKSSQIYEKLKVELNQLINAEKILIINKILTQEQCNKLHDFHKDTLGILKEIDNDIRLTMDYKIILYDRLLKYMEILSLDTNADMQYYVYVMEKNKDS